METTGCLSLKDLINAKKNEKDARSAQKENMCDRFRISPKVPLKWEPIDLSKQKGLTPERIPITPVKVDRPPSDPWTPTANLKMLSSVASPEIRDREKKKELFRPIENNAQDESGLDAQQFENVDDMDDLEKRPSRKQKSLGLLCQKFLARYPSYPLSAEKTTISLDEAASSLGVERRRIYDIVNVLESLHLVSRVAKNQYCWHGQHNLNETLKSLLREGERQNYSAQIAYFQHKDCGMEQRKDHSIINQPPLSMEQDCPSASASSRKDKSLRIMSQKFVMLFLVSTTKIITLEIAAKILIEESQDLSDHSKFKTKVRRLYDIANVLTSLGLIKKVHVTEERGRKPAFKWIGPVDFRNESDQQMEVSAITSSPGLKRDATSDSSKQQRWLRHSSFSHVQSINTVKRKVCSEPSSPQKAQEDLLEHDDYSSKMSHLAAICRQKIEEDSKCSKSATNNPAPGNVGQLPFSFVVPVPVDPDYCNRDSDHQNLSASPNKLNVMVSSNAEYNKPGFLPNQPYMYVPSTSMLSIMLCGNPGKETSVDVLHRAGSSSPSYQKTLQDDERPAKRQRLGSSDDAPLPLVVPKACSSERNLCSASVPRKSPEPCKEERLHLDPSPVCQEETTETMVTKRQELQERVASATLPQYLYVPSSTGINGFNFFLPASQATGALSISQNPLSHLNVPYVMVPSSALAAFPFICSPAVSSSVSAASSDHTLGNGSMNYNLPPGLNTPPPHIMFGMPSVVSSSIRASSPDLQPNGTPQTASPATADSSICSVHPLPAKNHKSPTPLTPKSIHPVHKDTFFKTPGNLAVSPALRKNERSRARHSSTAQRRLDICSTTDD
ncbi:transcription factor E2F7 [Phyllobates terribilis]|uniref:transcription factor E2F7 n=1 Tax=Phyllobates terribilis TaxID=111132 RepID=UPI003CCAE956